MSYCRWSSDDYQCDVYVYEDVAGGFTTHVAGNRVIYKEKLPEKVDWSDTEKWFDRNAKVMQMLKSANRVNIDLPHDGESFNDETAKKCADRLIELREIGYKVPQYAIDSLLEVDELAHDHDV